MRKLDELALQSSVVKPECFSQYKNACQASSKLGDFTHEAVQSIAQYTQARREGVKTDSIHQTIYNVTDTHLGIGETGMWDGCRKMLNGLLQDLAALAENVLDPEIAIKGMTYFILYVQCSLLAKSNRKIGFYLQLPSPTRSGSSVLRK